MLLSKKTKSAHCTVIIDQKTNNHGSSLTSGQGIILADLTFGSMSSGVGDH